MKWSTQSLEKLVLLSDSGTWGDEGNEFVDSPVLRSTNIQNSDLILEDFAWRIVPKAHRDKKKLDDGDIIITTSSGSTHHIGKCCLFRQPPDGRNYYFSNFTMRLRPDLRRLTSSWLQYWLSSPQGRAIMAAMNNTTSGLRNLDRNRYLFQEIPLPPLEEQKRIAAILDKADRVRRKRQEAIRLTEELGRSIFLDMFGDPVTNPKGWEIKKLRSVIQSIDAGWSANGEEKKCEEDEWGVLKVSAVTSGKFKPFEHKSVGKNPNFSKSPIIPKKGDLLFSRANTRELVAATCIVEQDYERIFLSDKLWRISALENLITPEYLKFLLTYQRYRDLLTKQATGTSGSMLNISQGKLLDMNAPIPDIETQRKFSDLIWQSIQVSTRIQENSKESENLFNSLLQRAFRGEL